MESYLNSKGKKNFGDIFQNDLSPDKHSAMITVETYRTSFQENISSIPLGT